MQACRKHTLKSVCLRCLGAPTSRGAFGDTKVADHSVRRGWPPPLLPAPYRRAGQPRAQRGPRELIPRPPLIRQSDGSNLPHLRPQGRSHRRQLACRARRRTFCGGPRGRVLPPDSALVLEGGERAGYVVASFCIGNGVKEPRFEEPGPALGVCGALRPAGAGRGGGAAGCEVAAHTASLMGRPGPALLGSSSRGLGLGARPLLYGYLRGRGVEVLLGCRIRSYEGALPPPRPDGQVEADLIVLATGVAPPQVFPRSRLARGPTAGSGLATT